MIDAKEHNILPTCSGVYRFYNKKKELIYVGKAKNLKKRVSSYFKKDIDNAKTLKLVEDICFIDYVVVDGEQDAFFLEDNLIKNNKPKYNILLKDNKTYPFIVLTNEEYPRLIITEHPESCNIFIFGPFSDREIMNNICDIIKNVFQIRTCNFNLTSENINNEKYKICLKYHLGQCCGVCEKKITLEEYKNHCQEAISFLKGKNTNIKKLLQKKMIQCSKNRQYKLAQKYKEQIESIENYKSKSIISNPQMKNCDVIYYEKDNNKIYFCYMIIKNGQIIFQQNFVKCL